MAGNNEIALLLPFLCKYKGCRRCHIKMTCNLCRTWNQLDDLDSGFESLYLVKTLRRTVNLLPFETLYSSLVLTACLALLKEMWGSVAVQTYVCRPSHEASHGAPARSATYTKRNCRSVTMDGWTDWQLPELYKFAWGHPDERTQVPLGFRLVW